jgi:hypothetical protein
LNVVVRHFPDGAFGFRWSRHAVMILAMYAVMYTSMYTERLAHG